MKKNLLGSKKKVTKKAGCFQKNILLWRRSFAKWRRKNGNWRNEFFSKVRRFQNWNPRKARVNSKRKS